MRVSAFHEFGPPEVLRTIERARPEAGPGEVRIRVVASTVNPTDVLMRGGRQIRMMTDLYPPYVCGNEFAGHVDQIGSGVSGFRLGQTVMGVMNPRQAMGGSHAEWVSIPATSVTGVPDGLSLIEAATLPMNGLTAMLALDTLALPARGSLLVTGGAGALGGYIIQLAKARGLKVVADAHAIDESLLRGLGADDLVPRGDAMRDAMKALYPEGVDGLIDCALLGDPAAALVKDSGAAIIVRLNLRITDPRLQVHHITVGSQLANTPGLASLAEAWRIGRLTPRVGTTLSMDQAAEAHRLVEQGGHRGRVVLVFDPLADGKEERP